MQARPLLSDGGKTEALVDPRLGGDYDGEQARRVAFVASLCVRAPATWRPSMTEVRPSCFVRWRSLTESQVNLEWQVATVPTPLSGCEEALCRLGWNRDSALKLLANLQCFFLLFGLAFACRRV